MYENWSTLTYPPINYKNSENKRKNDNNSPSSDHKKMNDDLLDSTHRDASNGDELCL